MRRPGRMTPMYHRNAQCHPTGLIEPAALLGRPAAVRLVCRIQRRPRLSIPELIKASRNWSLGPKGPSRRSLGAVQLDGASSGTAGSLHTVPSTTAIRGTTSWNPGSTASPSGASQASGFRLCRGLSTWSTSVLWQVNKPLSARGSRACPSGKSQSIALTPFPGAIAARRVREASTARVVWCRKSQALPGCQLRDGSFLSRRRARRPGHGGTSF